jgi:hypothetical protein
MFSVNYNINLELCSFKKFAEKKLQNSCQLAAPNNLCRIFFCCLFEISCFSVFAYGRIKPWCELAFKSIQPVLAKPEKSLFREGNLSSSSAVVNQQKIMLLR